MKLTLNHFLVLVITVLYNHFSLLAAEPANNECANAITLTVQNGFGCPGNQTTGTTIDATGAAPEPTCDPAAPNLDVWYKFVAPSTNEVTLSVAPVGSSLNIEVAFYDACGGTQIACFSSATANGKTVSSLTSGATYWVRVWTDAVGSDFTICLEGESPANDICANAESLTIQTAGNCSSNFSEGTTRYAADGGNTSCDNTTPNLDVWYSFTAPAEGIIEIDANTAMDIDIFANSCGGSSIFCQDQNTSLDGTLLNKLTAGGTYFIQLSTDVSERNFQFCLQLPATSLSNDFCNNPTALTVHPFADCPGNGSTYTTVSAIEAGSISCDAMDNKDIWFSFVAPSDGILNIDMTLGTAGRVEGAIYASCSDYNSNNSIFCEQNSFNGSTITGLTGGNTYLLQVWSDSGQEGTFDLCLHESLALPLELNYFLGNSTGPSNILEWETINESDISKFTIERSSHNSTDFDPIGEVLALNNSTKAQPYHFIDETPSNENNYRLRILDLNGHATFSNIIQIERALEDLKIYPNPFQNQIHIEVDSPASSNFLIRVLDLNGKEVLYHQTFLKRGFNSILLNLSDLYKGLFLLELQGPNTNQTFKIIKR